MDIKSLLDPLLFAGGLFSAAGAAAMAEERRWNLAAMYAWLALACALVWAH